MHGIGLCQTQAAVVMHTKVATSHVLLDRLHSQAREERQ